jgi:hypothetical protein
VTSEQPSHAIGARCAASPLPSGAAHTLPALAALALLLTFVTVVPAVAAGGPASPAVPPSDSGAAGGAAAPTPGTPEPPASGSGDASETASKAYLLDRLAAGASLGYYTSDNAQILSEMHFDFPFLVFRQKSVYVLGRIETQTVKTGSGIAADDFQAQDVNYLFEAGARDYLNNRIAIAAFVGQEGRKELDTPGSASVLYAGVGFESTGFPRPGGRERFEWRVAIGPTFDEEGVESDLLFKGAVLYDLWRGERSSVGIDGSFNSLFDGTQGQTEYRVGPRWTLPLPNGIRASLFAEWIRGRNPLLLEGSEGWDFGFKYDEGAYAGPHTMTLPDIRGVLLAGAGADHWISRFDLDLSSPEFRIAGASSRVFANLDANTRFGEGPDNLWYIASAGLLAEVIPRVQIGPVLYHRSNHTVDGDPTTPTDLNIVQFAACTPGWNYANRLPGRLMPETGATWFERIEAALIPGVVTSSDLDDASSWDLQAGVRVDLTSREGPVTPFVRAFAEWGGDQRREFSAGIATPHNLVFELLYQSDSQYFGGDKTDLILAGSLVF